MASARASVEGANLAGSSSGSSLAGGANLGWRTDYMHVLIGIDYNNWTFKSDSGSGNTGVLSYGFGLGYEWNLPMMTTIMLKGASIVSQSASATTKDALFGASVGIAYFISPWMKFNVDYSHYHQSPTIAGVDLSVDISVIGVGLSFPIDINYPTEWWRTGLNR